MKLNIFSILVFTLLSVQGMTQDFNYEFYPGVRYVRTDAHWEKDTTGQKDFIQKIDTINNQVGTVVKKEFGRFVMRKAGSFDTLYDMPVNFVGITADGSLMYRANTQDQESIVVNPMKGTVQIVYQKCYPKPTDKPKPGEPEKLCNTVTHNFGNIAGKK